MLKKVINWFEKHYVVSLVIAILIAIFIFYISSKSFEKGSGPEFPLKSDIYHFSIFFLLSFFLIISLTKGDKNKKLLLFFGVLLAIAYGISDELHQLFVPNRYCDVNDFLIDSIGILLSGVIYATSKTFLNIDEKIKLPIK